MGMLFNTDGTIRILAMANNAFKRGTFKRLQNNPPSTLIHDLQNLGSGATGIYVKVCTQLFIDDYDDTVSTNWQTFLNLLDTTNQPTTTSTISSLIGTEIALALQNKAPYKTVKAIEFFAVPFTSLQLMVLPPFPVISTAGEKTMIITIQTGTVDALLSFRKTNKKSY
jgi:hypothetical protein